MNKFYKTSYPKTSSINQILKNKKEIKRQTFRKEDLLASHLQAYKETVSQDIKQKPRFHLDNKIQIQSDLLFNKNEVFKKNKPERVIQTKLTSGSSVDKSDQRKIAFQHLQKRKQQNKTESGFYQASAEKQQHTKIRLRPQSKQQTRTRLLSGHSSKRSDVQRPQTSKGSRKNVTKQRLMSVQDQNQIDIIISKNRRSKKQNISMNEQKQVLNQRGKKKYNFQTSIDDQFLSLFAN